MQSALSRKLWTLLLNLFLLLFALFSQTVQADEKEEFPVLYQARYRPAEAYARLWLYHVYHAPTLKKEDLSSFKTSSSSPLTLLWSLEMLGSTPYHHSPIFWIGSAELKQFLGLTLTQNRFSYHELQHAINRNPKNIEIITHRLEKNHNKKLIEDGSILLAALKEFEQLYGSQTPTEEAFNSRLNELQSKKTSPKEIEHLLEQEYPLIQRLKLAGSLFKSLPSRYKEGEWFPLKALKVKMYSSSTQNLKEVENFTSFSNEHFRAIQQAYLALEKSYAEFNQNRIEEAEQSLSLALEQAFKPLAGKIIQEAHGKQLTYPTLNQLKIETLYVSYPWIRFLILLYGIGACILLISYRQNSSFVNLCATGIMCLAIFFHTGLIAMRCYILGRPPVSNMFETVIYVPWIAACASLLSPVFRRHSLALLAACVTAISLLIILEVTDLNQNLDQVQAVLDSQFWLLIHVLLVVGSYGIFILGAIIGHFYLGLFIANRLDKSNMQRLSQMILQTLYGGTVLLLAGTILGGIWAAESWGRFWDWDPKESWAFISCCFYLIWIHAYRFHHIASFGLAIGAVSGLLAISFTWYGVNYILGTGLHSYGFGTGGEHYYYTFLGSECIFLIVACWTYHRRQIQFSSL